MQVFKSKHAIGDILYREYRGVLYYGKIYSIECYGLGNFAYYTINGNLIGFDCDVYTAEEIGAGAYKEKREII